MTEPKLKPCPFCGAGAVMTKKNYIVSVYCSKCFVEMHRHFGTIENQQKTITADWNRRATNVCQN